MDEIYSYDWETDPETEIQILDEYGKWIRENLIDRQTAIEAMTNTLWHYPNECYRNLNEYEFAKGVAELGLKSVPSAQPTLYGYPVEHLAMIARVLQKENLPPERIAEMLSDAGRIVEMVRDEFEETLRKAASGSQNI